MAAYAPLPLDGSVVKMKGLPFKATPDDIIKFFHGFLLKSDNIYLKRHPDGRPNGEAFVVFEDSEEARRATQKDRETFGDKFGDRYVRVYPTLESDVGDMEAAVAQQHMAAQQGSTNPHVHLDSVVKMKSLPFYATQLDIIQFFDGFKLKPNGVQLVVRSDNKPTGEAFVDFENSEEATKAIREKDHKVFSEKFGDRYVRLIQVSRKEMQAALALRFGGEGILKVKGIPFKAAAADVRKFFVGYRIKADGVSFIMHADGRPTGMAFIEFETPQEAVRAMEKDRAKFGPEYGDRFCMLQLVGRHEMDKVHLQREADNGNNKLLNGISVLQAAALATQAAFNPSLQPMLMAGGNPWLSGLPGFVPGHAHVASQMGQLPGPPAPSGLDAQLSANQFGNSGSKTVDEALIQGLQNVSLNAAAAAAAAGLNPFTHILQHSSPHGSGMASPVPTSDVGNGWMESNSTGGSMLFYPPSSGDSRPWSDARVHLSGLSSGSPVPSPLGGSQAQTPLTNGLSVGLQASKASFEQNTQFQQLLNGPSLLNHSRPQLNNGGSLSPLSNSSGMMGSDLPASLSSSLPLTHTSLQDAGVDISHPFSSS